MKLGLSARCASELRRRQGSDYRTKFPIKALGTLKALAADVEPIPIPQTVIAPAQRQRRQSGTNGVQATSRAQPAAAEPEVIVID